ARHSAFQAFRPVLDVGRVDRVAARVRGHTDSGVCADFGPFARCVGVEHPDDRRGTLYGVHRAMARAVGVVSQPATAARQRRRDRFPEHSHRRAIRQRGVTGGIDHLDRTDGAGDGAGGAGPSANRPRQPGRAKTPPPQI
ncbi:uncharacterized protein METZ01_LOCUS479012, partial [marine metagenome]